MNFKKTIAIATILANLAMPICAKNYSLGMETKMENQYKIDLVGNFSENETKKISNVMKSIEENFDRKKAGIEKFTIENVDSQDPRLFDEDSYASAVIDYENNAILMSTATINGKAFGKNPLADFEGLLGHEIGHLIYPKYADEIFDKYWDYNLKRDKYKEGNIPDGYVSAHPLERPFWTSFNEDFADDVSYIVNKKNMLTIIQLCRKSLTLSGRRLEDDIKH